MEEFGRRIPGIWGMVDEVRAANVDKIGGPDWPAYCYLPLQHAAVIAARLMWADGVNPTPTKIAQFASVIATLSAWRMTQGIYRFDPSMYSALIATPVNGDLPAAIIQHIPQWCVYVETPELTVATTVGDKPLRGAFAWLDRAFGTRHDVLTFMLDGEGLETTVTHVPLVGSLQESLANVSRKWREAYARGNAPSPPPENFESVARKTLMPLVSLVLYLCSEAADVRGKGEPKNPEPVRTRRHGMRLFPTDGLKTWDVGVRMGTALRQAYENGKMGQKPSGPGAPTFGPHVRGFHWHTYIFGPRAEPDRQRRVVRWMPPIPVLLDDPETLTSVVRPVQPHR